MNEKFQKKHTTLVMDMIFQQKKIFKRFCSDI